MMKQAVEALTALSADPNARRIAEARQKELNEQAVRQEDARALGRQEAISHYTGKMEELGYSADVIAKVLLFPSQDHKDYHVLSVGTVQTINPCIERLCNELRIGLSNFEYVEIVAPGILGGFADVMFDIIPNLVAIGEPTNRIEQIIGMPLHWMKSPGYI